MILQLTVSLEVSDQLKLKESTVSVNVIDNHILTYLYVLRSILLVVVSDGFITIWQAQKKRPTMD